MQGPRSSGVRIVHATAFYAPHVGGVENHVARLAAAQVAEGHDVRVVTYDTEGTGIRVETQADGVVVERVPPRVRYFKLLHAQAWRRALWQAAEAAQVLHVHAPFPLGLEAAIAAGRGSGIPVVVTYHGEGVSFGRPWYAWPRKLYSRLEKQQLAKANDVVFLSHGYRDSLRLPANLVATAVIGTGVDADRFSPTGSKASLEGEVPVLYVGSLVAANRYKGVDLLIRAAAQVPSIHLHVVGRGDLIPELTRLADQLDVAGRVTFHQGVSDEALPTYYRAAQAFVLPSRRGPENGPLVLVEAMASGTPVVVTRLPGVVEMVEGGRLGTVVEPDDVPGLSAALQAVARSDAGLTNQAKLARKVVLETRTWRQIARQLDDVYRRALMR